MNFSANEQAMKLDKCWKCNTEKQMYYKPWCPRCDKPMPHIKKCVNLIQTLNHLELDLPGIKDHIWEKMCDYDLIRNDSYTDFNPNYFGTDNAEHILNGDKYTEALKAYLLSIGLGENEPFLWEISW